MVSRIETGISSEVDTSKGRIIVILGPEGSGKSTQAKLLSKKTGYPHIGVGDLLREKAGDGSEIGNTVRETLGKAGYVDPDIVLSVIKERIQQEDARDGFVIEGTMRSIDESDGFFRILEEANRVMPVTHFYLKIPYWLCVGRLMSRQLGREDDASVEKILKRLSSHNKDLGERTKRARQKGDFYIIPSSQSVAETHDHIMKNISN